MAELLFRDNAYLKSCEATVVAVHGDTIELDRTVFYPLGGGQAGDTGRVGPWRVGDTRKGPGQDQVFHVLEPGSNPAAGGKVELQLDWERRHRLMRLHTALHLLGAVVKAPVTGGRIADDKAHLDFDIEMERLVKDAIEAQVNELVRTMSVAPPRGEGRVRLLEIPGIDLQACGGTHVADTAEIGALKVVRIRSEGKRNKRVTLELA